MSGHKNLLAVIGCLSKNTQQQQLECQCAPIHLLKGLDLKSLLILVVGLNALTMIQEEIQLFPVLALM